MSSCCHGLPEFVLNSAFLMSSDCSKNAVTAFCKPSENIPRRVSEYCTFGISLKFTYWLTFTERWVGGTITEAILTTATTVWYATV